MVKKLGKKLFLIISFLALSQKNINSLPKLEKSKLRDKNTHPLLVAFRVLTQTPNKNTSCFF